MNINSINDENHKKYVMKLKPPSHPLYNYILT